jgi:NTE family protein
MRPDNSRPPGPRSHPLSPHSLELLHDLAALRGLPPAQRRWLEPLFVERHLEQGEVLYREGDPSDEVYVLASGAIDFLVGERPLARLGPRELFGEQCVLGNAPRGATALAARDATILVLPAAAFQRLMTDRPELYGRFVETIARRMTAIAKGQAHAPSEIVLVLGRRPWTARRGTVFELADVVERELGRQVGVLTVATTPPPREARRRPNRPDGHLRWSASDGAGLRRRVAAELAARELETPFLFVVLDERLEEWAPALGPLCGTVIVPFNAPSPEIAREPGQRTVVLHDARDGPGPALGDNAHVSVPADEPERSWALARLARHLGRRSIGVALGSGAAWGFAHIGVLDVLDDAGIPVDVIAGASMGAIVGAHYALGFSPKELERIATSTRSVADFVRILPRLLYLASDFNVLRPGMFAGERFQRLLASMGPIGDRTFADLRLPFRAVATDIDTGGRAELCEGSLSDALRASFSAPWLFTPFEHQGKRMIDGGMCDPVPSETARAMGADLVVAVNVVPPVYPSAQNPLEVVLQALGRIGRLGLPPDRRGPNSFDVVVRTLQIMQHELGNHRAGEADVFINPDLRDYWVLEFWRAAPMIACGREAARAALPEIRKRLEGRQEAHP